MNEETQTNILSIPDAHLSQGCKATWGLGNQILLYGGKPSLPKDGPSGMSVGSSGPTLYDVQWNTDMHGPITRKLVNEAHNVFLELQQHEPEAPGSNTKKAQMVKFSRRFRAVLKACVLDFQQAVASKRRKWAFPIRRQEAEMADEEAESQMQLYNMVELVWSLCEILFIEAQPGGILVTQLLDWLRLHFTDVDRTARAAMQDERPEDHEYYWSSVYIFVLQGRMDEARQMLSVHSQRKTSAFEGMDELLRKMPVFSKFTGQLLAEFDMRWRHWQEECSHRLHQGNFVANKNLQTICRILCGKDDVFIELKSLCQTWYCMMVSRVLYQNPTINAIDLQHETQDCIDTYGGNRQLQPWDHIILAALEFDIHQVIKESCSSFSGWWFASHLTDLLYHAGQLDGQQLRFGGKLREFLLLEYASGLMSHNSLWQVGASYLDHCKEFGRQYLEQFVEHLPIETEVKAHKVIHLCECRKMQAQVKSICKVMAVRALHQGRLGSALTWGIKAKDIGLVTYIAERFLDEYTESGDFSNLDLVDHLGSSMLLSDKLTFLGKYREFHHLYTGGELRAAASLLLSLLTSRLAPKKFWTTLLLDALPLLEAQEVVFNTQQTYELMHCLEEHMMASKLEKMCKASGDIKRPTPAQEESEKERLDMMKLGLARNLARAILQEGNTKL